MIKDDLKYGLQNSGRLQSSLNDCKKSIEEIECEQYKVGGSIIKMPENNSGGGKQINLITKKINIEKRMKVYGYYLELVDRFLMQLDGFEKEIIFDRYFSNKSMEEIGVDFGYSSRHILNIINKCIDDFVKTM